MAKQIALVSELYALPFVNYTSSIVHHPNTFKLQADICHPKAVWESLDKEERGPNATI